MSKSKWLVIVMLAGLVVYLKATAPPVDCRALANSPGFDQSAMELYLDSGCPSDLLHQ